MKLKMFRYNIWADLYIELAIVHTWKKMQGGMTEQLSQQQNVILGNDLRANSQGL